MMIISPPTHRSNIRHRHMLTIPPPTHSRHIIQMLFDALSTVQICQMWQEINLHMTLPMILASYHLSETLRPVWNSYVHTLAEFSPAVRIFDIIL